MTKDFAQGATVEPQMSKLRSVLWPIHRFELKKFLPMFLMFGGVNFNYSLLRITKDTLVVNASASGSAVIPHLKLWGTLPAAILFMMFYVKLSTIVSRQKLFYYAIAPFLIFFALFGFVLYPLVDVIHPTTSVLWLRNNLPVGLHGLVDIYANWTFSIFYILAELWGSVVLSTMYWGFANEITKVSEAKRFYGLLGIGANIALLAVSPTVKYANSIGDWSQTIHFVVTLVLIAGFLVCGLYWYINNIVMKDVRFAKEEASPKSGAVKTKKKLSFKDSIAELSQSKYLAYMALMVLCYGISINLVEVSWKQGLKELFAADKKAFIDFQAMMMSATGLTTIILLYLGTGNIFRVFGWRIAALVTPIMMLITSTIFFGSYSFADSLSAALVSFGASALWIVAWSGGVQNVLGKGCKYAFFDPSKEVAYIPLDEQMKRTGKAAIDGVGGRLGKSGGSLINMILIGILGSVDLITPYVGVITIGIVLVWIVSINRLNVLFLQKT